MNEPAVLPGPAQRILRNAQRFDDGIDAAAVAAVLRQAAAELGDVCQQDALHLFRWASELEGAR
jgi:hypothetical protein